MIDPSEISDALRSLEGLSQDDVLAVVDHWVSYFLALRALACGGVRLADRPAPRRSSLRGPERRYDRRRF